MLKILTRYTLSAAGIVLLLLTLNLIILFIWFVNTSNESTRTYRISDIAAGLSNHNGFYSLSDFGNEALKYRYQWAMLLNEDGDVIWSQNLPSDVARSYSLTDVSMFTRWYLNDYPVYVWKHPDGLLVLASPKFSSWKVGLEMPQSQAENSTSWIGIVFVVNILAVIILTLFLGLRLFHSLRVVAAGIDDIANRKPVRLPQTGLLGDIASKLNQTSILLQKQTNELQKRDRARADWITGISHDIRTPLSMIMGYAGQLEENPSLGKIEREQASIIRRQSEKIRTLINDLNLASKLEYGLWPLQRAEILLPGLLRQLLSDFLNDHPDGLFNIDLQISPDSRNYALTGDEKLLFRAVSNLINNCVKHNPHGCTIKISLSRTIVRCHLTINDDGKGMPPKLLDQLNEMQINSLINQDGLGLTIVRQVVKAHQGEIMFKNLAPSGFSVIINLPLT